MGFITLITLWAKEGQRENLIRSINEIKKEVEEKEPGTKKYHLGASQDDPNELWVWEEYESDEALAIHAKNEAVQVWKTKWDEQLARPMRKQVLSIV
ncbi:uncharacterized protein I303_103303 [Kwoniella dejecticola CBS 10117]|uniref:ABM domain-containing protein n=1 Tax=Kwoniella dejecticola CBS 10117 TaxID=1296121 RepID=A0A1A6A6D5_9TREE|nr:uncharacterized protein I303_03326 [Kwoniella dejecticola CBS 10117]OBR85615.1 hypothetical protein I303_03326 [Kwoniella dejecticola CBS 10117]